MESMISFFRNRVRRANCFFTVLCCCLSSPVAAQYDQSFFAGDAHLRESDSNQLFLEFRSTSFLRNNEYENPVYKGYTLIGFNAEPRISWQAGNETRVSAGWFFMRYDGHERNGYGRPVFRVQQKLRPGLEVVFGSLERAGGHLLPHPVYSLERNLNQLPEEGLQILYRNRLLQMESWIVWEQFLLWGENKQEKLSGGLSALIHLTNPDDPWYVRIPGYLIASHRGGQIDVSSSPVQTLLNTGTGAALGKRFGNSFVREAGVEFLFHQFSDASPQKQLATEKGFSIYPACVLNGSFWRFETGYWSGHSFYAPKGDPLFSSIAFTDGRLWKKRNMSVTQVQLNRATKYGVQMGLQVEFTYDTEFGEPDYSYSFYLRFYDQWQLWKKKSIF
jgi:hypothetical protein